MNTCRRFSGFVYYSLFVYIAQCCAQQHVEVTNDYRHNDDEQRLRYTQHYSISHAPSQVHLTHREQRMGGNVVGVYALLEPNGYVRSVHYQVNGAQGYHAVVQTHSPGSRVLHQVTLQRKPALQPLHLAEPVAFVL